MRARRAAFGVAALIVAVACGQGATSIGSVTLDVPEAWQVTGREADSVKITNGTIGSETGTRAGTATAVFDVYVDSSQTLASFDMYLREQNIRPRRVRMKVGGHDAVLLQYSGRGVGGRQEALFVPSRRVFVLYRAAFRNDDAAFGRGRAAFRRAIASIRFVEPEASSAA